MGKKFETGSSAQPAMTSARQRSIARGLRRYRRAWQRGQRPPISRAGRTKSQVVQPMQSAPGSMWGLAIRRQTARLSRQARVSIVMKPAPNRHQPPASIRTGINASTRPQPMVAPSSNTSAMAQASSSSAYRKAGPIQASCRPSLIVVSTMTSRPKRTKGRTIPSSAQTTAISGQPWDQTVCTPENRCVLETSPAGARTVSRVIVLAGSSSTNVVKAQASVPLTLRPVVRSSTSAHRTQAILPRLGGGGMTWIVAQCGHAIRGADNAIRFP